MSRDESIDTFSEWFSKNRVDLPAGFIGGYVVFGAILTFYEYGVILAGPLTVALVMQIIQFAEWYFGIYRPGRVENAPEESRISILDEESRAVDFAFFFFWFTPFLVLLLPGNTPGEPLSPFSIQAQLSAEIAPVILMVLLNGMLYFSADTMIRNSNMHYRSGEPV